MTLFQKLFQLPLCAMGKHERDRRHAGYVAGVLQSHCKGCGRSMIKEGLTWRLRDPAK